jgi:hypothetical protein
MIAAKMKEVVDLVVGGEEPLRLAGRFKLLHLPLSCKEREADSSDRRQYLLYAGEAALLPRPLAYVLA